MWEFVAGAIAGLLLAEAVRSRSHASRKLGNSMADRQQSRAEENPRPAQSEADRVHAAAEKGRLRARELGLPALMDRLAPNRIMHWPNWIKEQHNREVVLRVVQSAELVDERVRVDVDGEIIEFGFKENFFEEGTSFADADVFWHGSRVLSVSMGAAWDDEAQRYSSHAVNAFVEGPWIGVLQTMDEKQDRLKREEERRRREAPEIIAAMKKDFGV